jgi:tetratricopeptide (TPR) repeat protein
MPEEAIREIIEKGRRKAQEGNYTESLRLFERALSINPGEAMVWFNKGWVLKALGRYEEAVEAFDRGLDIAPASIDGWRNKSVALYKLGRYSDAIKAFDRVKTLTQNKAEGNALRKEPGTAPSASRDTGQPAPTQASERARRPEDLARGAGAHHARERSEDEMQEYDRALAMNPDDAGAWCRKGLILLRLGRWDEAYNAAQRALEINRRTGIKAWLSKGLAFVLAGKPEAAGEALDEAIADSPGDTWVNMSLVLVKEGRYEEAILHSDQVLEATRKSDVYAWETIGHVSVNLLRYHEALEAFDRAISFDPDNTRLWYAKGFVLFSSGQYHEALDAVDQAISLDPGFTDAWHLKGWTLNRLGRFTDAEAAEHRASELKAVRHR